MSGRRGSAQSDSFRRSVAKLAPRHTAAAVCEPPAAPSFGVFTRRPDIQRYASQFTDFVNETNQASTKYGYKKKFFKLDNFLDVMEQTFGIVVEKTLQLNQEVVNNFRDYLDGEAEVGSSEELGELTRTQILSQLERFINWGRKVYPASFCEVSFEGLHWKGAYRSTKHHVPLSPIELVQIVRACKKEIELTRDTLRKTWAVLDSLPPVNSNTMTTSSIDAFWDESVRLQYLDHIYKHVPVFSDDFRRFAPGLSWHMKNPRSTMIAHASKLYLTPRTLLPYILMCALPSNFNPSTLLDLRWTQVEKSHPLYGSARWRLKGLKLRPYPIVQNRSFAVNPSDPFCVPSLLMDLEWYFDKLQSRLYEPHSNHVFVAFQGLASPASALLDDHRDVSHPLQGALKLFIEENELPDFTLVIMRASGADLVNQMVDGDPLPQKTFQQHRWIGTTEISYRSGRAKRRGTEKLAHAMNQRERYANSDGKVDNVTSLHGQSVSAATPGFLCWDPTASPMPGQIMGRLCTAYGCCPACQLGSMNIVDPIAVARLMQLQQTVASAPVRMHIERFIRVWLPVKEAIEKVFLPKITARVLAQAMSLSLNPIPEVE